MANSIDARNSKNPDALHPRRAKRPAPTAPRRPAPTTPGIALALALALAAAAIPAPAPARAHDDPPGLRAGAAASVITAPLGTSLNGGMADRLADFVHDEQRARALVLDNGTERLAIVVCDLCMIDRDTVLAAKARVQKFTGIPPESILISATHTHTAGTVCSVFQSDPEPGYPEFVAQRAADAAIRADRAKRPASIAWGVGRNERQVFNRRYFMKTPESVKNPFGGVDKVRMNPGVRNPDIIEPAGPVDPAVPVVLVRERTPDQTAGAPIALFANYALHYVGGVPGAGVSADYFGEFARRVADKLRADPEARGRGFVGILSNGASGDINNIDWLGTSDRPVSNEPFGMIRLVAEDIAEEAVRVANSLHDDAKSDGLAIASRAETLELGVRKPDPAELERARRIHEEALARGPVMRTAEEIYARESIKLAEYPDTVPATVSAHRVGDLAIVGIPCEVFVEIGLEIKAKSPFPTTVVVSLANGYNGYLPTERHHELGGYETWRARSSYLETAAASKITAAALRLLENLKTLNAD